MHRPLELSKIILPQKFSHKGQNGRLLIIGGSHLLHAASLWSLTVASRIVDLVHYASVPENNRIVQDLKAEFRDGIIVPRTEIENYIEEDDCVLIGPGMVRANNVAIQQYNNITMNLEDIEKIEDGGQQTAVLTNYLLQKYPHKQWVIDAGALQMCDTILIPKNAILTPHRREFDQLKFKIKNSKLKMEIENLKLEDQVKRFALHYRCIALTGDVLAGLIAALVCKNDPWVATVAGSYINKQAGDELYKKVGYFFNASDLADEIPKVMKKLLVYENA